MLELARAILLEHSPLRIRKIRAHVLHSLAAASKVLWWSCIGIDHCFEPACGPDVTV